MAIEEKSTGSRLDAYCTVCKEGVDAPNKGMGRAIVAAWKTRHQHPEAA